MSMGPDTPAPSLLLLFLLLCPALLPALLQPHAPHSLQREGRSLGSLVKDSLPCSVWSKTSPITTIDIRSEADFAMRLAYSPNTTVLLRVTQNITLYNGLLMNSSYSCTLVRPHPSAASPVWLNAARNDTIALRILTAANIQFSGISFSIPIDPVNMPACSTKLAPEMSTRHVCPTVLVNRGWAIVLAQGSIIGRVDLARVGTSRVEYMDIYHNFIDQWGVLFNYATIRVQACGDPVNLVRSGLVLANNRIRGCGSTILVHYSATGVSITNNDISGFAFSGIQLGLGVGNGADSVLGSFTNNYIYYDPASAGSGDGSGVYFDTHWYGAGNRFSCNYIVGNNHCYYLDYVSSGVLIDGGVCLQNIDGIKVNTGKSNVIRNLLMIANKGTVTGFSCQNWCTNNCFQPIGTRWQSDFLAQFNNAEWRQTWPWLFDICNVTSYNGVQCTPNPSIPTLGNDYSFCGKQLPVNATGFQFTPNVSLSGGCSGYPTLNDIDLLAFDNPGFAPRLSCNLPMVPQMNSVQATLFNSSTFGFDDPVNGDYGVSDFSALAYQVRSDFTSCPRSTVGIQKRVSSFASASIMPPYFNKQPADWWYRTYEIIPYYHGKPDYSRQMELMKPNQKAQQKRKQKKQRPHKRS